MTNAPEPSIGRGSLRPYARRPGGDGGGQDPRRPWRHPARPTHQIDYTLLGYGAEANNMLQFGDRWYKTRTKHETEQAVLPDELRRFIGDRDTFNNEFLRQYNVKIVKRYHIYDPVIQLLGANLRPYAGSKYMDFTNHITNQPDGGTDAARQLDYWWRGNVPLAQLRQHLQDFAIITHVAESARGYTWEVRKWDQEMGRIATMTAAQARARWNQINDDPDDGGWFWPSQEKVNEGGDYVLPPDADGESSDSDLDAQISDDELMDLDQPPAPPDHRHG